MFEWSRKTLLGPKKTINMDPLGEELFHPSCLGCKDERSSTEILCIWRLFGTDRPASMGAVFSFERREAVC